MNKKHLSEFKIYSFYFILLLTPFIYAFQLVLDTYLVSYLIYIAMMVLLASQVLQEIVRKNFCIQVNSFFVNSANSEKIAFSLAIYIAINGLNDIYYLHSYIGFLRALTFFCLPILLFTVFAKEVNTKIILLIITISGLLVSLETLWEFFNTIPTLFEQLNFNYVKKLSGRELHQLLGWLRPTGLIEHLHATQTFLVITFLCATIGFIQLEAKGIRLFFLGASIVVLMAVIANGTRLILVGGIIAWIVLYLLNTEHRNKLYVQLFIGILSIICLYYFSSQNQYFWHVAYLQYPIRVLAFIYPSEYTNALLEWTSRIVTTNDSWLYMFGENSVDVFNLPYLFRNLTFLNILFGLGFGTTSFYLGAATDDFYIAQFFAQLGIIGSFLLTALLFRSWKSVFLCLSDINSRFKKEALILVCFLILFPFFVIHSGILLRKSCWILFCLMILISVKIDNKVSN